MGLLQHLTYYIFPPLFIDDVIPELLANREVRCWVYVGMMYIVDLDMSKSRTPVLQTHWTRKAVPRSGLGEW